MFYKEKHSRFILYRCYCPFAEPASACWIRPGSALACTVAFVVVDCCVYFVKDVVVVFLLL